MGLLEAHAGLAGKVAVVVGGAGEIIGRAVTLGLAKAGVSIATCDIHEDAVAAIVGAIPEMRPHAPRHRMVRDLARCGRLFRLSV
jgi:NAD(P)-dependent dehydrogenase (short-subunit alcohol dehydrogenase family)